MIHKNNVLDNEKKVAIIGLDGMSWPILNKLFEYDAMPNLERITEESIRGIMKSTIPPNSACAWTSITSGVNPGKHGVFGFTTYDENFVTRVLSSRDIFYPRIHEITAKAGLQSVCINLPLSYPINELEGLSIITDWVAPKLTFYPDSIKKYVEGYQFHSGFLANKKQDMFERVYNGSERRVNTINRMMKDLNWNLFFALFSESDHIFHSNCEDVMNGKEAPLRIFKKIDESFKIAEEESDLLIVVSDHGFSKYKYAVYVNSILEKMGYVIKTWNNVLKDITEFTTRVQEPTSQIKINETLYRFLTKEPFRTFLKNVNKYFFKKDVQAMLPFPDPIKSKAFVPFTGSYGIHVKEKEIIDDIINVMNQTEYFLGCWKREEIYWGSQVHKFPEIMFLPNFNEGYTRGETSLPGKVILERKNWWQHHPDGIVIINGKEIYPKWCEHIISSFNIVPTALKYLNLPIPKHIDGIPIKEIPYEN